MTLIAMFKIVNLMEEIAKTINIIASCIALDKMLGMDFATNSVITQTAIMMVVIVDALMDAHNRN